MRVSSHSERKTYLLVKLPDHNRGWVKFPSENATPTFQTIDSNEDVFFQIKPTRHFE